MADRLSGTEVEEWFRKFARETSIISNLDCSPEILVRILNKEVKDRFDDALVFVDARIPNGTTWINEILNGRITGDYSDSERKFLSDYLLDKVFATDVLIDIKDNQGIIQKLAVDVTANTPKETRKLDKIQGKPNKKMPMPD
ncbi:MAG: hypothetical protein HC852_11065 [Acaryochloridaceae cyanobacterium RU_4_10]|nr:hypothetical protein [Acaryochloridaceae cyanobacterium RU_4_10]